MQKNRDVRSGQSYPLVRMGPGLAATQQTGMMGWTAPDGIAVPE
jgi:hypothetical protein